MRLKYHLCKILSCKRELLVHPCRLRDHLQGIRDAERSSKYCLESNIACIYSCYKGNIWRLILYEQSLQNLYNDSFLSSIPFDHKFQEKTHHCHFMIEPQIYNSSKQLIYNNLASFLSQRLKKFGIFAASGNHTSFSTAAIKFAITL